MKLKQYGLTQESYDHLHIRQGGVCAICQQETTLVIDHDHSTGKVRGLLCNSCNLALGLLKENYRDASRYLMKHHPDRSWDRYFVDMAVLVSARSKDRSTQVGAVIVRDQTVISTGYNGFPRGVDDEVDERHERPAKYLWTCHAEENAILNASRIGASTQGSTIYVTPLGCCARCARGIHQAGITRVVVHQSEHRDDWGDDQLVAEEIFQEAGIQLQCHV